MSKARRLRKANKKRWLKFSPIPRSHLSEQMRLFERDYRAIETSMRRFVNNEGVETIRVPFKANAPFFIGIDSARPGSDVTVNCVFIDDLETTAPSVPKETPSE